MIRQEIIKGFLIFEKRSGRPYIHRTYPGFNADPFLLIGFLNAMIKFAKEAMVGKTDIRLIDMHNLRFAFMESHGIIFTAISSNIGCPLDLEFKIKTIESLFLETFSEEELMNPSLSIAHYNNFNPIVDEIIEGEVKFIHLDKINKIKKMMDELKQKNDDILGLAIISFTGIVLVNGLELEHYDLIGQLINNLFSTRISGIEQFIIQLIKISIYIQLLSIDSFLVTVINRNKMQDIRNEDFRSFKSKISEMLKI